MTPLLTFLRGWRPVAWLADNPLLVREMRRRMRGRSFTWALIGYLAALGLVSCFLMYMNYPKFGNLPPTRELIRQVNGIGTTLFRGMLFVEAVIAIIVTPMITAGLATAEKEKDTFEFLQVTTLSPGTFVLGCLLTTGSFLFMVFACTLPILGLTFIFGGVSLADILIFNGMLFLLSLTISAWGIFNSTSYKRSRTVLGAIALVLLLLLVLVIPSVGLGMLGMGPGVGPVSAALGYVALGMGVLIAAFSVAAARRLYEPNNRLFSYLQFIVFFVVAMGLVMGLIFRQAQVYGAASSSTVDEMRGLVVAYFAFGWLLLAMSILIFSAGRVERGDELWRLRLARPRFRRGLDAGLVYLALSLMWVGATAVLAVGLLPQAAAIPRMLLPAAAPALSALLLLYALCRLMSITTQTRNRAAVGAIGLASIVWILLPLLGYFMGEISNIGSQQPSVVAEAVSGLLKALSPAVFFARVAEDPHASESLLSTILLLVLALGVLGLTLVDVLRRRLVVTYDYNVRGGAPAAPAGIDAP